MNINIKPGNVCVVTVTYGNRFGLLEKVVKSAFQNGAGKVIIVNNASHIESFNAIQNLEKKAQGKISVISFKENQGSAGGFKSGLQYAIQCQDCEYIWLLDDDNVPSKNALVELLKQYHLLCPNGASDRLALSSFRESLEYHQKVVSGISPDRVFKRRSSFMRFHIFDIPYKLWNLISLTTNKRDIIKSLVPIPYAPYGGLFIHSSVPLRIGFPDEKLYLYVDDSEYTIRLSNIGGEIFLVTSSRISDIQRKWSSGYSFPRILTAESDLMVYYAVRNHSYFDYHYWQNNSFLYFINKYMVFFVLGLFALKHRRLSRLMLIIRAVQHGESRKLGRLVN